MNQRDYTILIPALPAVNISLWDILNESYKRITAPKPTVITNPITPTTLFRNFSLPQIHAIPPFTAVLVKTAAIIDIMATELVIVPSFAKLDIDKVIASTSVNPAKILVITIPELPKPNSITNFTISCTSKNNAAKYSAGSTLKGLFKSSFASFDEPSFLHQNATGSKLTQNIDTSGIANRGSKP